MLDYGIFYVQRHRKRWTGISEKTVTGFVYLDLLEQYVFPQIETFEQETLSRVIFMQDRAPPHFSCFVTDVLNERFPDARIGRGGPIPWPPRSPDLSPLDFFLWGYIKNIVYAVEDKEYPASARKGHISH